MLKDAIAPEYLLIFIFLLAFLFLLLLATVVQFFKGSGEYLEHAKDCICQDCRLVRELYRDRRDV